MRKRLLWSASAILPIVIAVVVVPLFAAPEAARAAAVPVPPEVVRWGFVAAALAAGLAALGAAYAVAVVGAAAMGAIAEKPETAGRALIFVGLAEGIAIYGLIIAIMILGRLG
jgi:V/A-type H+-transporting ATPase subunit K